MKNKVLIGLTALMFVSCGTQKTTPAPTVNTNTKVTVKEVFVRDTVYLEIPAQQAERTTPDSVSFFETDYAASTARINSDGTLFHDLKNKAQKKSVECLTPAIYRDSLVYVDRQVNVPVSVERKLTFWEKTSIKYFTGLSLICVLSLIWIFKKPIFSLLKGFIKFI